MRRAGAVRRRGASRGCACGRGGWEGGLAAFEAGDEFDDALLGGVDAEGAVEEGDGLDAEGFCLSVGGDVLVEEDDAEAVECGVVSGVEFDGLAELL